mmetsp:Transcript_11329/g.42469  ORF Transcript_11329/g.42469 Transcript_11329/m.42469 type:complete len:182 (-) Transcript_11329:1223-1768(-)
MTSLQLTTLHPTTTSNLSQIQTLESISYPEDEAATEEKMKYRLTKAPSYFMSWWGNDHDSSSHSKNRLIGFICGTKHGDSLVTHHSMSEHQPDAKVLHIHSVVVHPDCRRQGLATAFLKEYIQRMREQSSQNEVNRIVLMCKDNLIGFYKDAGFVLKGESECEHGEEKWFDMYLDLCGEDV